MLVASSASCSRVAFRLPIRPDVVISMLAIIGDVAIAVADGAATVVIPAGM
jgi:hypothetical protein